MTDNYWNSFYSSHGKDIAKRSPSQFAVFVHGETEDCSSLIDLGTGNGRDAFFFASHGKKVLGLDASHSAIEDNTHFAHEKGLNQTIRFERFEIGKDSKEDIVNFEEKKFIYARFFLHSLNDELLKEFAKLTSFLMKPNEKLFVEYRTDRDSERKKIYDNHYRNFLNPNLVEQLFNHYNLNIIYSVEGLGYAKYKEDDAHVSRMVFKKS
tara:strand:- start:1390 stop:2016 length:627 start_codon:yes stop_codon:yes gene_type:complete